MGLLSLLNIDYTGIVNQYINTIFEQVAASQGVKKEDITFSMRFDGRNGQNASKYIIIRRDGGLREEAMMLPDELIEKMIRNAKK